MPILEKCSMCHRLGRYAEKDTDKICARCKRKVVRIKEKPALEKSEYPPAAV